MSEWRNRIIGSGEEVPDQLLAHPGNWRVHPKHQQDALAGVLDEVGWVQQVIVNQQTGHLVDGHLRVALALRRNEPKVPVIYVDLSPEEEALILTTLDPITALAVADKEKLDELLREVSTGDAAVQQLLSNLAEEAGITLPQPHLQDEPLLPSEHIIEMYCDSRMLDEIRPILSEWSKRPGVTLNIS